jgi:hypothetical protein
MKALAPPKLGMFAQVGKPTDYQAMRYGLTSCLMDDGYFTFNGSESYNDVPWFDEYDAKLGQATTGPPLTPWQKGIYRRDFQNGIALVNPKGNGTQTVTLEAKFTKIAGSQAPSINDGHQVTSITLQDRDGIILLRTRAVSQASSAVTTR